MPPKEAELPEGPNERWYKPSPFSFLRIDLDGTKSVYLHVFFSTSGTPITDMGFYRISYETQASRMVRTR